MQPHRFTGRPDEGVHHSGAPFMGRHGGAAQQFSAMCGLISRYDLKVVFERVGGYVVLSSLPPFFYLAQSVLCIQYSSRVLLERCLHFFVDVHRPFLPERNLPASHDSAIAGIERKAVMMIPAASNGDVPEVAKTTGI